MNKLLHKLAEQAFEFADGQLQMPVGHPDWHDVRDTKFAELIVQMCANIVRNSSLPDSYSEACLEYIADELEEHFGVEP